jgi:NAD-dependent SIR2 family protein deacetylase
VQGLPEEFHSAIAADKEHVDLLIVIGSSLKVKTTVFFAMDSAFTIPIYSRSGFGWT